MDIGFDLYFIIWKKKLRGGALWTPLGGQNIDKTCFGSYDISIKSPWKALFKYVNWMLIWPLIWPSAAENDQKIVFFITVFFRGACPSTPNEIRIWILVLTLILTYIFTFWTKIEWGELGVQKTRVFLGFLWLFFKNNQFLSFQVILRWMSQTCFYTFRCVMWQ